MRKLFLFLILISVTTAIIVWVRYGGGEPYRDLSTAPLLNSPQLEHVLGYPEPIGNVVVSDDQRVFFTVHPESRPQGNKLLEWEAGAAVPFPDGSSQPHLFDTVLGLTIDQQHRLWTIDHGKQGFAQPRLLAFDLATGQLVHDHSFRKDEAPAGSFLQELQVSHDGRFVIVADGSILRKRPALLVYDVQSRKAKRVLESHESVAIENYVIRTPIRDLSYFGGLFAIKGGVNGLVIDARNEWLYFAALNNSGLYRVRMDLITDAAATAEKLAASVERYSDKPLSDGLGFDNAGNLLVTDIEHNAVFVIDKARQPRTLIRSDRLRWAASVSSSPDGYLYIADSAFPELVLQSKDHILSRGPYSIFRIRTEPDRP